jgi:hypothetical protein
MNIRDNLKAYLDGELSAAEAEQVKQAIEADPELKKEAEELQALSHDIRAAAKVIAAEGLEKAMKTVSSSGSSRPIFWQRRWVQSFAAAAAVAILAIVFYPVFGQAKIASESDIQGQRMSISRMDPAYEDAELGNSMSRDLTAAEIEQLGGGGPTKTRAYEPSADAGASFSKSPVNGLELNSEDVTGGFRGNPGTLSSNATGREIINGAVGGSGEVAKTEWMNRLVVRRAAFTVYSETPADAAASISSYVRGQGGFIEDSSVSTGEETARATMTIRIPADKYEMALEQVRGLGDVENESSSGDDVTLEVADLGARAKTMKAEEDQVRILMKSAKGMTEIIQVREKLNSIRSEIEALETREKTLKRLAQMSSIHLTLLKPQKDEEPPAVAKVEPPKANAWIDKTWDESFSGLASVGKYFGSLGIRLLVYAPIWLPFAAIIWWALRRFNRPMEA